MKLIYILLTLCLCLGCKSKRELSRDLEYARTYQEQKDILEHESTKRDSESLNTIEIIRSKELDLDTETNVKIVEYDTSKPIDPATGKPPVLRESESTIKAKKMKKMPWPESKLIIIIFLINQIKAGSINQPYSTRRKAQTG